MQHYLISEGYTNIVFTDEITGAKVERVAPQYSFDILADNIEIVRHICKLMDTGIENEDFMIFLKDQAVGENYDLEFAPYMLN